MNVAIKESLRVTFTFNHYSWEFPKNRFLPSCITWLISKLMKENLEFAAKLDIDQYNFL